MTKPVINRKPAEPTIPKTDIGYTIVKQRFGSNLDYDLSKVGGWSRVAGSLKATAAYSEIDYDMDNRIFTWSGLTHDTDYTVSLSYLDDFILGSPDLIQAQYLSTEDSLDLIHTNLRTKEPITITTITNEVTEEVVANPFSDLVFTYTGVADVLRIQVQKVGGSEWQTIFEGAPSQGMKVSLAGGTYTLRYISVVGFSDGTIEEFPAKTYPTEVVVDSGLGAPVEVSGLTLASFKTPGSVTSYDLRISWTYPTDLASQNKKRNFTVTVLPNPLLLTDYANLNWTSASEEIAIASPYIIKPFPYRTAYVVRIGVMGWGTEASDYVYTPVYISKDGADSGTLGYLVPSDSEAPGTTKIQIDDEHIRAYSVFNPSNPAQNKLMFEVDAATGNVIIGRAGGAYNNTAITTAPFIFDSVNNKLQVSGRVITDQIESASYVLTWIDGDTPSLRTAGKSGYGSGAPGIWMGYTDLNTFKLDLGNATNYMRWDGTELTISGTVRVGGDGRTLGQSSKQVFIYKRYSVGTPDTPTGGSFSSPVPAGWSTTVPTGSDALYMSSRLFTSDGAPPQEPNWATPSLFMPGSTGTATTYTWIKYADTVTGTNLSDDPTGKDYIGIAVNKEFATESLNAGDYTWSRLTGTPGVPGIPGTDGQTYYTWIKYSQNANGIPMTDAPDANTQYIGIAVNKTTGVEGTDASEYVWSKFKGDQGVPGVNNFKSTVFRRSATNPGTPTGGTYASPIPASGGWTDGIPAGEDILWASTRIFAADNSSPPHQANWTAPVAMTNTVNLEIRYSTVVSSPGDPTNNAENWSSSASTSTIWMAQRTKTNSTWSAWNVTKIKGEQGIPGTPGVDGKVLTLTASTQTVTFNAQDVMTPAGQTISFTVSRTANITGNTVWSAVDNNGTTVAISGLNTSATLDGSALQSVKSITVTATADGLSDRVSIAKIKDGADALVAILTNESHGVPADKDGVVSSFSGAGGNMLVFRGNSNVTNLCAFSLINSAGATGSVNASGAYSVTAMSADIGTLTIKATLGAISLEKTFTVTKSRAGLVGKRGAGQYSAVYSFSSYPSSIDSGMAAAAKAACPEASPVVGDIVTLRDSDLTKRPVSMTFNGPGNGSNASDWALFSVTIDGNLLVNGTVGADKINVDELFAQNAVISGELQVGSSSGGVIINGNASSIVAQVGGSQIFNVSPSGGFVNGDMLGSYSVPLRALSKEITDLIESSGGTNFEFGGSAVFNGSSLFSTTVQLDPSINCALGTVTLSFSYGGNSRYIISATNPGVNFIQLQFKRNTVNIGSVLSFYGTTESLGGNEWYCSLPIINYSDSYDVPEGPATFAVQITVSRAWSTPSLGSFSAGAFQQPSGSGVANMNINDLLDVAITSATNGQVLTFEGGSWINKAASAGSTNLDSLTDVVISTPSNGQILQYNGTSWVNAAAPATGGAVLTFGSGLNTGSYNGSTPTTVSVNSSSTNTASTIVSRDTSGNFSAGTITANLIGNVTGTITGNAGTATKLATARTIQSTGDVSWSVSFDGSATASSTATLSNSGVTAATYGSTTTVPVLTVDSKGRITLASNVTPSIPWSNVTSRPSTFTPSAHTHAIKDVSLDLAETIFAGSWKTVAALHPGLNLYPNMEFEDTSTDDPGQSLVSSRNGIQVYNNEGNGSVTITRLTGQVGVPNSTGAVLQISTTSGTASPGRGGFYFENNQTRAGAVFLSVLRAKIPVGYTIDWASNPYGSNGYSAWLTSQAGTGKWEDYAFLLQCGDTGTFSLTNYFYLNGSGSVTWQLASAAVYDISNKQSTSAYKFFAPRGRQSNPSYSFLNDTNTGMWSSAPDTLNFSAGGVQRLKLDTSGALFANVVTCPDVIATSDIRVKANLQKISNPIDRLRKLKGGFTFNRSDMGGKLQAGIIANYLKEALPEAVTEGEDGLLRVSSSGLLGLLVEVCTEQQKRIEDLEKVVNGNS